MSSTNRRRGAPRGRGVAVVPGLALVLVLAALFGATAHGAAAAGCDNWTGAASDGLWQTAGNWDGGVPTSSTAACITLAGNYTVTIHGAAAAKSLTLGVSNGSAHQTLVIEGVDCGQNTASLTLTNGGTVRSKGILALNGAGCGGNNHEFLTVSSGALTNSGTIESDNSSGGDRHLQGNITNQGTIAINTNTRFDGAGGTLDNQGALAIADTMQFLVASGSSATVIDDTGGSINASGSGNLFVDSGNTYQQGAGTTSGSAPVYVQASSIVYTGGGSSSVIARGTGTLAGDMAAGQTLILQGVDCGPNTSQYTAAASFTNAGTIQLSGTGCGGNNVDFLTIASPAVLTNTGTIETDNFNGGGRHLQGNITNQGGSIAINTNTSYDGSGGTLTNAGALAIADATQFLVTNGSGATVIDAAGGSITSPGSGNLFVDSGNTYRQGAGTTSGSAPVYVRNSAISYTGGGASSVIARGTGTLAGNIASGQTLILQGVDCGDNTSLYTAAASFTNAGTIQLTGAGCGGNNHDFLVVSTPAVLTNTGTIEADPFNGGSRHLQGDITNQGTIAINANTRYDGSAATLDNKGAITIADTLQFLVTNGAGSTVFDDGGGSITAVGSGNLFVDGGNTYQQGAGTTTGSGTVFVRGSAIDYTAGGESTIIARATGTLSGDISAGQTLILQGVDCADNTSQYTAAASFTNAGTIQLTGAGCGGNNHDYLVMASPAVLTNTGTIETDNFNGGSRHLRGDIANQGTIAVNTTTAYDGAGGTLDNAGTITIDGVNLNVADSTGSTITNAAAGTIDGPNGGTLFVHGGNAVFNEAGATSGTSPVLVESTPIHYTGVSGTSQVIARGVVPLAGNIALGQTLKIQGVDCGTNTAHVTVPATWTNAGTVQLTGTGCGGNNHAILETTGTIKNTGTIQAQTGVAGERAIDGLLDNRKVLGVDSGVSLVLNAVPVNYSAGTKTLTGGTWNATGTLRFPTAAIETDAAKITVTGGGGIVNSGNSANALTGLDTIAAGALFSLQSGASLATSGGLTNNGQLFLGGGSALVLANGFGNDYAQSGSATLKIGITDASTYGHLFVSAPATTTLSGTLAVSRLRSFVPTLGTTFQFLSSSTPTGAFTAVTGTKVSGSEYLVLDYSPAGAELTANQVTVSVTPSRPAPNAPITVNGSGFSPNESVKLLLDGNAFDTVTADSSGSFSANETAPGATGRHTITATGQTSFVEVKKTFTVH